MTIKFIKDFDKFKKGQVLDNVFRNGALELIKDGIAEEVGAGPIDPKKLILPDNAPKQEKAEK